MYGILLALIVSFLKAGAELTGKFFTSKNRRNFINEYSLAFGGRLMGAILVSPVVFFIPLQVLTQQSAILLACSTLLNAIATVTALKAVKYGDLSLVGPLSALTIPFLLLTGYVIGGEIPNTIGIIGVLFIFIGTYFLGFKSFQDNFFAPIKNIIHNPGAKYMIVTALIWSFTTPIDKLGILEHGVFLWILYLNVSIAFGMGIFTYFYRKESYKEITNIPALKKITLMTALGGLTLLLQMFALKLTLAVYVISIKRASGIFSVLLGAIFFKERNIAWKLFATLLMLAGVLIIALGGNI